VEGTSLLDHCLTAKIRIFGTQKKDAVAALAAPAPSGEDPYTR